MKGCFYQTFRHPDGLRLNGWGDCNICTKDEKNKNCRGYIGVSTTLFETLEEVAYEERKER